MIYSLKQNVRLPKFKFSFNKHRWWCVCLYKLILHGLSMLHQVLDKQEVEVLHNAVEMCRKSGDSRGTSWSQPDSCKANYLQHASLECSLQRLHTQHTALKHTLLSWTRASPGSEPVHWRAELSLRWFCMQSCVNTKPEFVCRCMNVYHKILMVSYMLRQTYL